MEKKKSFCAFCQIHHGAGAKAIKLKVVGGQKTPSPIDKAGKEKNVLLFMSSFSRLLVCVSSSLSSS